MAKSGARSMMNWVAVVSGGGGGIGSAICRKLAEEGARVVLTYSRSREKTEAVAESLAGTGHMVAWAPVDDSAALKVLAEEVARRYGRLDLLVNNAGITKPVPHDDLEGLED
ncbi:MAG: SDR family NAD(P)-dependent oxidoreductase, partial [Caldilineae bacterium]